ncbi:uncharacterized protein [Eurosta solidaginis]|uniref:uncharacterized protein n=1 Tax=Eurosta solidaginis TaxID=178769 RepID=UPI003530A331
MRAHTSLTPRVGTLSNADVTTVCLDRGSKEMWVISAYMPHGAAAGPPPVILGEITAEARRRGVGVIIGADANAQHSIWGSSDTNTRSIWIPFSEHKLWKRVIFEHNLLNWQNEQGVNLQTTVCGGAALLGDSIITEKTLEDILNKSVDGKHILEYYSKQQVLNPKYRKLLAATIAAYLISSGVNTNPKTFESLANQITPLFLSESKDIYYIHKKGQKPGGSLYTKYHNSLSKLRFDGVISKKPNEKEQPSKERNFCTYHTEEKSWLKYNVEPFDEVETKWILTFEERHQMLEADTTLDFILQEWPIYKQSFGHLLINADFNKLYPGKKNLLFKKWIHFTQAVRHLFNIYIKDSHSLETWKLFKEG